MSMISEFTFENKVNKTYKTYKNFEDENGKIKIIENVQNDKNDGNDKNDKNIFQISYGEEILNTEHILYDIDNGICNGNIFSKFSEQISNNLPSTFDIENISKYSDEAFDTIFSNLTVENGNLIIFSEKSVTKHKSKFIFKIKDLEMRNRIVNELKEIDKSINDVFNAYYR